MESAGGVDRGPGKGDGQERWAGLFRAMSRKGRLVLGLVGTRGREADEGCFCEAQGRPRT